MKVILAKNAGFCMGVKKAMNMALEACKVSKERIYTIGPLVHNEDAVNMLKKNDVYPVKSPDELSDKKVFIRAHGIPPSMRDELIAKGNTIIDLTCPNVVRVQNIAQEYAKKGYGIIIVGDHGHAEVEGILGYCDGKGYVVSSAAEVANLPALEKVCVIAQTTQSAENFHEVVKELKKRFKEVVVKNTICGATSIRQKEILELAEQVDIVIVVGGKHSANTKRLEELSLSTGAPTILIENASQLDENIVKKYSNIGVTAGASTPSWVIDDVINKIESVEIGAIAALLRTLVKYFHLFIDMSIFLGIGAVGLYYSVAYFLGVKAFSNAALPITIYLFTNSVHFLNSFYAERIVKAEEKNPAFFSTEKLGLAVAGFSLLASLALAAFLNKLIFIIHLALCVSGMFYSKIKFSKRLSRLIKFKSLKDIPASRDVFQSVAWAIIIVGYPAMYNGLPLLQPKVWVASFFVGCIVFARSIVYDMKDIRLDKLIGKETLPMLFGEKNTKAFLVALLGTLMAGLLYIKIRYLNNIKIDVFLCLLLYMLLYLYLFHKKIIYKGYLLNIIIDGQFLLSGILTKLLYKW